MNPVERCFFGVVEYDVNGGGKKATGSLVERSRFVTQMGMLDVGCE
jgi:hypothetical protein